MEVLQFDYPRKFIASDRFNSLNQHEFELLYMYEKAFIKRQPGMLRLLYHLAEVSYHLYVSYKCGFT